MSTESRPGSIEGFIAPGFEPVGTHFADLVAADPYYSAQFCAYVAGDLVVDISGGSEITHHSIQGIFSATKGLAAVAIALLLQRGLLDLDALMTRYWPEFAQSGKGSVTVRMALSHQSGLIGVEPQVTLDQLIDHNYMATRVAAQRPHWRPGAGHGYHGLTIGTLMDELVRRIDGRSVSDFFREEIGAPRGIDVYIATPESEEPRVLNVLTAASADHDGTIDVSPGPAPDSLTGMAFNTAAVDIFDPLLTNLRSVRAAGFASAGGAGSARGLARLYATCTNEVDGMPPLLGSDTVAVMSQLQAVGDDLVLGHHSRFGVVFQKADARLWYGSHQAFGHDGAGGAIGIADPWHDLAYGFVPRRTSVPAGADRRGLALARTVRNCLSD